MYKVFINNCPLILCTDSVREKLGKNTLFLRYDSPSLIKLLLDLAHTEDVFFDKIYLVGNSADQLFDELHSRCKLIEAAGGRVRNGENRLLMIFRRGKWDLPKGKMEKGESPEEAALREVEEECGVKKLEIIKTLTPTFHTYLHKERIVLKKTYWFEMKCADKNNPTPQEEEDITEAKWMGKKEENEALKNTYRSIVDVVRGETEF